MITYFIIGTIIQFVIIIERYVRLMEVREAWKSWKTWIGAAVIGIVNIILWPITIVSEVINIKNGI